ncbi:peptidase M3 [Pseudomonas sp. SDI]|uniref:M3 family metallopeptidase n=1 Tax=Pseudomonas sp. SDI TaxID=2170734 RepID=UPI000DE7684A|nr:M3 family metallopeptidase [Pseudomonas sp. SDI]PWB31615.1 peptidase M3 [Pseudomonas sp. SDI]
MSDNPLLQPFELAPYDQLRIEHLLPAIGQVIAANRQALQRIVASQAHLPTWDDLVKAVDALDARLNRVLCAIIPLANRGSPWSEAVHECYFLSEIYRVEKEQNVELYALYDRLAASTHGQNLSVERKAVLAQLRHSFRISCGTLSPAERERLADLKARILVLEGAFGANLGVAAQRTLAVSDPRRMAGVPALELAAMAQLAAAEGREGWLIPLREDTCQAVLEYAEDRTLREEVYRAFHARASELDPGPDNAVVLHTLATLRHEKAQILSFASFADLSVERKTADSVAQVQQFLDQLLTQARPLFTRLRQRLEALNGGALQPWDVAYQLRAANQRSAGVSAEQFRTFFPLHGVLQAMLALARQLFAVDIVHNPELPTWHADVQVYEVSQDHALLGYLYIDALGRQHKDDAVWTLRMWNRHSDAEGVFHKAAAVLICTVRQPPEGEPALVSHLELRKLLHEFGHCLHQFLVSHSEYSLTRLERLGEDGSEFPAETLERWAWSAPWLASISAHYQHGEAVSQTRLEGFLKNRRQQECLRLARELAASLFDLRLHQQAPAEGVRALAEAVYNSVLPWPLADFERPASALDHLVTGYEAGYYCYLWSRVHALDAFERFEQEGLSNRATGKAFEQAIFAPGTLRPLSEGFIAFRGRPVSLEPFLSWHDAG